jgi:hypothetical protein
MPASARRKAARARRREMEYERAITGNTALHGPDTPQDVYEYKWRWEIQTLMMGRRRWTGLPESVDVRQLERLLALYGAAVICDDGNGFAAYAMNNVGGWDVQADYPRVMAQGADGETVMDLTPANSVIIWDNTQRTTLTAFTHEWARDLASLDLEIARNVKLQNAFFILTADKEQEEDAKKIMANMGLGDPGMLALKGAVSGERAVEPHTLQTGVAPIMDKLYDARNNKLNEIYLFLGIDYNPVDKKERVTTPEATSTDERLSHQRRAYMLEAEKAVRQMRYLWPDEFASAQVEWDAGENTKGVDRGEADTASE